MRALEIRKLYDDDTSISRAFKRRVLEVELVLLACGLKERRERCESIRLVQAFFDLYSDV